MWKKFLMAMAVLLFLGTTAYADSYFDIENYEVTVDVGLDRSYTITEKIQIDYHEPDSNHGFIRHLPQGDDDTGLRIPIEVLSVEGDTCEVSQDDGFTLIRVGDPDTFANGLREYTLVYRMKMPADLHKDMDLFYHNVIPFEWDVPIHRARVYINMPEDFDEETLYIYSGEAGSRENTLDAALSVKGQTICIEAKDLDTYNGITVALELPENYFSEARLPLLYVLPRLMPYLACVVFVVSLIYYKMYGVEKPLHPKDEYYPPDGLSPLQIGYIIDNDADDKDIAALILYWGSKGHLRIIEGESKEKKFTLQKLSELPEDAPAYEQTAFYQLFALGDGNQVSAEELSKKYYTTASFVSRKVPEEFRKGPHALWNKHSEKKSGQMSLILGAFLAVAGALDGCVVGIQGGETAWVSALIGAILFPFAAMMIKFLMEIAYSKRFKNKLSFFGFMFGILFSAGLFSTFLIVFGGHRPFGGLLWYFIGLAVVMATQIVTMFISRRSDYGQYILERVIGFRSFLRSAEKSRFEEIARSNPSYFYEIIPYASVLGVSKAFVKNFEDLTSEPPSWYTAAGVGAAAYGMHRMRDIYDSVSSTMQSIEHASVSAPGGSSSSGGSYSSGGDSGGGGSGGGGSGGGGGTGW